MTSILYINQENKLYWQTHCRDSIRKTRRKSQNWMSEFTTLLIFHQPKSKNFRNVQQMTRCCNYYSNRSSWDGRIRSRCWMSNCTHIGPRETTYLFMMDWSQWETGLSFLMPWEQRLYLKYMPDILEWKNLNFEPKDLCSGQGYIKISRV